MRTRTQNGVTGNDGLAEFAQHQQKRLDELQFFDSTTVKVEQTTRGVRLHVRASPSESAYAGPILCKIVGLGGGNVIQVQKWSGAGYSGDAFWACKSFDGRQNDTYHYGSVTFSFVYSGDNNRVSTNGTDATTENQELVQLYQIGDSVYVQAVEATGVTMSGIEILFIETSPSRKWTKISA